MRSQQQKPFKTMLYYFAFCHFYRGPNFDGNSMKILNSMAAKESDVIFDIFNRPFLLGCDENRTHIRFCFSRTVTPNITPRCLTLERQLMQWL